MARGPKETPALQKANRMLVQGRNGRRPHEIHWWLNVAFIYDEQYSEWSSKIENIRTIPRDEGHENDPRPIANKIKHFTEAQHAFFMQQVPVPDVEPTSEDPLSLLDNQTALAYCQWASSAGVSDFPRKLSAAAWWAVGAGMAYLKWTWNPLTKQPQIDYATPFEVVLDPYARDWDDVRWLIHSKFMDKERVYDLFGVELQQKHESVNQDRARLLHQMGATPNVEGLTVNELWQKPSRRHPGGRYGVWAGPEQIVPFMDLPYTQLKQHNKLPFTPIGTVQTAGSPYYESHVKTLRPQQMELNKTHAQYIIMRENFAHLKWWVPEETQLEKMPGNSPFQVLKGSGIQGVKPEIIAPPAMPLSGDDAAWIVSEMEDSVGIHKASQGQVQGRLESAKAIESLVEGDKVRLNTLFDTAAWAIGDGFWQTCGLAQQYEKESKMVVILGDDGVPQVKAFKARDIDPAIRFKVSMGTGLGYSRAGRTENLFNLWDRGLLQDDPARIIKLLDIGGGLPLDSSARDIMLARNENIELASDVPVAPNSWDNHVIHIEQHNDFRKTLAFRYLNDKGKAVFEFHVKTHENLMLQELEKQALQQMVGQGASIQNQAEADPAASAEAAATGGQAGAAPPETEEPTTAAPVT